jgi:hypothetical protein
MTWFKVDDSFHSHPAVRRALDADPASIGLWLLAGSWTAHHQTGGILRHAIVEHLGFTRPTADVLVRVKLWVRMRGGAYRIATALPAAPGCPELTLCAWERTDYRRKIPDAVRALVYERDEQRCVECGSTEDLTLDHIHPWSLGGPDTVANLRVLCRPCNSSKGARV